MKKTMLLICVGVFANLLGSCTPGTNKNAEDYGSGPARKNAPVAALTDLGGSAQKTTSVSNESTEAATTTNATNAAKTTEATPAREVKEVVQTAPKQEALNGEALLSKSDCLACHKLHEKVIGPAYDQVALKYPATEANIKALAEKIIKGGSGVWGTMPMTPHPTLKEEEARAMVKYILSVKK